MPHPFVRLVVASPSRQSKPRLVLDWSRLAISVRPRTLGFQFSDPAFQRVNVLVEVEYREHRYAYVPAVPLELEPTNKLFLSLSRATLPNTRNVHPLMIAETDLDAARLKARLVAKPRRREPVDSCCGSACVTARFRFW
jgi:hypothetical protein